jgi:hypothetical protein
LREGKKNWEKCICSRGACIHASGSPFHLIDWQAFGSGTCVKPASFGLLCAWRKVLILRQQALFSTEC